MGNCFTSGGDEAGLPELPGEEKIVVRCCQSLGLQHSTAQECVEVLQSNATGGKLNEGQFNTVVEALKWTLPDMDTIGSKMFAFFKHFREKKAFDLGKLLALGLLLSKGSLQDKAGPMFDSVPNLVQGEADAASLRLLFGQMVSTAADLLPLLAIDESPQPGQSISEEACHAFIAQLDGAKDQLVSELVEGMLFGLSRIRKPDFETRIRTMPVFQVLAAPDRIRGVLFAKGKAKPRA